jgi:hypothetical protein
MKIGTTMKVDMIGEEVKIREIIILTREIKSEYKKITKEVDQDHR